ncbi:acyl-CoA dehydrogenase family protein [Bacillus toyonensis]|uniref:acyl-CoA dehydrogenase family protein n=2 Tax=Bacillus cereus group TaxID=86661 RepID=UPI00211D34DC|nr:acyl-CoA dehydrogenase family protein [Bacillus toyonensis]
MGSNKSIEKQWRDFLMDLLNEKNLIKKTWEITEFLQKESYNVDKDNRFPYEGINLLKEYGFMGLIIPKEFGGLGHNIKVASKVVQILASGCLSTSMIFGMHCQQVMTVINHAKKELKASLLEEIAIKRWYIASVTSEKEKGGHLLTANSPLKWNSDYQFGLHRDAPIVTGGSEADAFLITVKKDTDSLASKVLLVYANRDELDVELQGSWASMGMRGTQSVSMSLDANLNKDNILTIEDFKIVAQETLIPMGHIMWVSSWLGATKGIYRKIITLLRNGKINKKAVKESELLYYRLSKTRLLIDTVDIYLEKIVNEYTNILKESNKEKFKSYEFNIHLNNLKILGSENLFKAVDEMVNIAGLKLGYLQNNEIPLERVFRDLRAASLMYHNDRLKLANGKISLFSSNLLGE